MSNANSVRFTDCDDDVHLGVCSFLRSRHFPSLRRLDVQVKQGTVTLSGRVYSYYEKQVALTSSQKVAGVLCLIDCIVVSDFDWDRSHSGGAICFRERITQAD